MIAGYRSLLLAVSLRFKCHLPCEFNRWIYLIFENYFFLSLFFSLWCPLRNNWMTLTFSVPFFSELLVALFTLFMFCCWFVLKPLPILIYSDDDHKELEMFPLVLVWYTEADTSFISIRAFRQHKHFKGLSMYYIVITTTANRRKNNV